MIIAWSFSCEILVLGISHLPMTTPKSTIQAPQNSQSFYGLVDSSMAKASFLGVVSFGRFAPDWGSGRLGSSPYQEKIRERRTWDIRSISNVTCKNWRENLLLFSTGKPRLRRKNPMVKFGALAGYPSPSLPTFLSYFRAFFDRSRASLFSTP
jgi:hypothetical protein